MAKNTKEWFYQHFTTNYTNLNFVLTFADKYYTHVRKKMANETFTVESTILHFICLSGATIYSKNGSDS